MKRVLLTGATGFIGRHCLPALLGRGYEVHAVSSRSSGDGNSRVHWHRVDLFDAGQALELVRAVRPSHLLHLAWITEPGRYRTSPENLRWVEASLGLLRWFHENAGNRVVMAGTCAEYDWNHGFCREGVTPLAPSTPYGIAKHALQLLLDSFARQVGLSAAWGRIFFLYGPHAHPARFPGAVITSLLHDQVAQCSHGNQLRDFLYVSDAADALVSLLDSEVQGPLNIASGSPIRLKDMIAMIADLLEQPKLVARGTLEAAGDEPPLLVADAGRLNRELGWSPRYDLKKGLTQTIDWWKSNPGALKA